MSSATDPGWVAVMSRRTNGRTARLWVSDDGGLWWDDTRSGTRLIAAAGEIEALLTVPADAARDLLGVPYSGPVLLARSGGRTLFTLVLADWTDTTDRSDLTVIDTAGVPALSRALGLTTTAATWQQISSAARDGVRATVLDVAAEPRTPVLSHAAAAVKRVLVGPSV